MSIETRLAELGLQLPQPAAPLANYVPYKFSGNQLFVSGMVPIRGGSAVCTGHLGAGISIEQGQECSRVCVLNALGWAKTALDGDLAQLKGAVRVRGFVACTAEFTEQPAVINGASDLLVELLGEPGRHTRAVVGSVSLPLGLPVEIDFIFEAEQPVRL